MLIAKSYSKIKNKLLADENNQTNVKLLKKSLSFNETFNQCYFAFFLAF
jgi:hypothetical protein